MRIILSIIFLCFIQSCCRSNLVTEEPSVESVVGKYEIASYSYSPSIDSSISDLESKPFIELKSDGSLVLSNMPIIEESDSGGYSLLEFRSGEGTYSISPLGGSASSNFYGIYMTCGDFPNPLGNPWFKIIDNKYTLSFEYFRGDFYQKMSFASDISK